MAHRGLLSRNRYRTWIGFAVGFAVGGTLTHQVHRFGNSEYYAWNGETYALGHYAWKIVTFPCSLIRAIPSAIEVTPGSLAFVLVSNAFFGGAIGSMIGRFLDKRQLSTQTNGNRASGSNETRGGAQSNIGFFKGLIGLFVAFFGASAALHGIACFLSHAGFMFVWWCLFIPTNVLCKIFGYEWPTYADPTMWQNVRHVLTVSLINGGIAGGGYCVIQGLKTWRRKRGGA